MAILFFLLQWFVSLFIFFADKSTSLTYVRIRYTISNNACHFFILVFCGGFVCLFCRSCFRVKPHGIFFTEYISSVFDLRFAYNCSRQHRTSFFAPPPFLCIICCRNYFRFLRSVHYQGYMESNVGHADFLCWRNCSH